MELSTKHSTHEKTYTLKGSKMKTKLRLFVTSRFTRNIKKTSSEKPKEFQREVRVMKIAKGYGGGGNDGGLLTSLKT